MNYYRRYVGDYLRDTSRLSMLEHGAYNLLLDYYYAEEAPIPLDLDEVYRMVRALKRDEQLAVQKVLNLYFERTDDGYRNGRADEEIETSQQARKNGSGGGRPRKTRFTTEDETGLKTGSETGSETGKVTGGGGGSGHPPTSNLQPPTSQPPAASSKRAFALPEWVDPEAWAGFEAMRLRIRKPMTDRARALIVAELLKLRAQGHEPNAVLDQSTRKSWQDVYEIKGNGTAAGGKQGALEQRNAETANRWVAGEEGRDASR